MRKIALWIINITGWVLDAKELLLLLGGSSGLSAIITAIIQFFVYMPKWLLIIALIGLIIMLFVGFGYLWDTIKRRGVKPMGRDKQKDTERLLIEDLKIKQDLDKVKKARGLEIENQDAELRRTSIDMKVKNAGEVIGASFKQTNKPAFSAGTIACECGESFGYTFTGNTPDKVKCPNCGKTHRIRH